MAWNGHRHRCPKELDSGNDKRSKSKRKAQRPAAEVLPAMHSTHAGALEIMCCVWVRNAVIPGIEQVDGDLVAFGSGTQGRTGRVVDLLAKMPRRSVYAQLSHIR